MEEEVRTVSDDNIKSTPMPDVPDALENLPAEAGFEQLAREKAELEDLLRRRQAEFENFRRRMERERAEFAEYAGMQVVRSLLPIVDDFERALKAAEATKNSNDEFLTGVQLIHKRLLETLTKEGLQPIPAEPGRAFDPHSHEAVQRIEQENAEDGTILDEYQRGYNYKGKLLRPSMVKVAVRP